MSALCIFQGVLKKEWGGFMFSALENVQANSRWVLHEVKIQMVTVWILLEINSF